MIKSIPSFFFEVLGMTAFVVCVIFFIITGRVVSLGLALMLPSMFWILRRRFPTDPKVVKITTIVAIVLGIIIVVYGVAFSEVG